MYNWQKDLWSACSGSDPTELKITMAGRGVGKSHWTAKAIERLMNDLQNQPITGLVTSEGTVYGARYYCVEPIGGNWKDMEEWCTKSFGDAASVWDLKDTTYIWPELGRWYMNDRRFWFRNVKDRDWFIIRWNS